MFRFLIKLALVLGLLFAGWSGLWVWGAGRIETEINNWLANEKARGRDISCQKLEHSGYPFRLALHCTGFAYQAATPAGVVAATMPKIDAVAMVWDPKTIIASLAGPLAVSENGSPMLKAEWSGWRISATMRLDGFFDIASTRIDALKIASADGLPLIGADSVDLRLAVNALTTDTLDINARAAALTITARPQPLGPAMVDIDASILKAVDYQHRPVLRHPRAWQQAGGSIDLRQLRILNEPALVSAQGQMALTADGRPDGQLTVQVVELENLIEKLGLKQAINPMVLAGITLFGRPATIDGRAGRAYPLAFREGQMQAGPVRVPLPPLW